MLRTKIVATLGPATDSPEVLGALIDAGVDLVRLNAAHAGPGELSGRLQAVRKTAEEHGRQVGVLLDLPGPKLRVGEMAPDTLLERGHGFRLITEECVGDEDHACVSHQQLADDVHPGSRILLDDGRIELRVTATAPGQVDTEVVSGGPLSSHKGLNVPGVTLSVDAITRYDRTVLAWAMANDVDWIGQSFVRSPRDVEALREYMTSRMIPICAKIEKHEAAERLQEIVAVADGLMVARGDLAVETSPEQVPVLQRHIISAARSAGKPVIVATEMLDSMRNSPRPTRAEASDVANAIFSRTDAVMLSGETAVGKYPIESVETMVRIARTAEFATTPRTEFAHDGRGDDIQAAVSSAVVELSGELDLAAIVTITQSGATARAVSRLRPETPIVAATPSVEVMRKLAVVWGVRTVQVPLGEDIGLVINQVADAVVDAGYAERGELIALTAGLNTQVPGGTDFLLVSKV